jgi:hypothetical protein
VNQAKRIVADGVISDAKRQAAIDLVNGTVAAVINPLDKLLDEMTGV